MADKVAHSIIRDKLQARLMHEARLRLQRSFSGQKPTLAAFVAKLSPELSFLDFLIS
jgi:hypothetical protein